MFIVDNLCIEYKNKEDSKYLIHALKENYEVVDEDWNWNLFWGASLNWNYKYRTVDLSMPGYIEKVLQHFQYVKP